MTRRFLQGAVGEGTVGGAKELRGEVLRESRNNRVVSGDPERSARRRAPRMFHVKTLTPTAVEGNAMSCRRRRNPVRSAGVGVGRLFPFAVTQSAAGQTAPTRRSSQGQAAR